MKGLDVFFKKKEPLSQVSLLELKALLILLAENANGVCFRYRLIGQMWHSKFMRVVLVTDHGVFLKDEKGGKVISISDLTMIVQFELDGAVHTFQPNFHYGVVLEK